MSIKFSRDVNFFLLLNLLSFPFIISGGYKISKTLYSPQSRIQICQKFLKSSDGKGESYFYNILRGFVIYVVLFFSARFRILVFIISIYLKEKALIIVHYIL